LDKDVTLGHRLRLDIFGQDGANKSLGSIKVIQHGRLDDQELRTFYSAVDVFVVPSRMEGFPNTALEALACGTPVIAFGTGPMADYLQHGETALLAEPFSASDLAKQIHRALTDQQWRDNARYAGVLWVGEHLSSVAVAEQWADLFARLQGD
jgi:glycosyltransferase involved in cell wall biosynthesis